MQIEHKIERLCKYCDYIAYAGICAMMMVTVLEMVFRKFGKPIPGTYDVIGLIQVVLVSCAIPYCTFQKGHIRVEMFVQRLPRRAQTIIGTFIDLLSVAFFVVVTWQCFVFGNAMRRAGEVTMSAFIPQHPFIFVMALSCAVLCLLIFYEFLKSITKEAKG
jgi:TRAP-type C4-dicarboxylate transport system permease small subunit